LSASQLFKSARALSRKFSAAWRCDRTLTGITIALRHKRAQQLTVAESKNEPSGKNPTSEKAQRPADPWKDIVSAHEAFLTHLECISEMFEMVLPVIKKRDAERDERIKELSEAIESETGKTRWRIKSIEDIQEFLGHVRKIRQAEKMFRQSIITSIVSKFDAFFMKLLELAYRQNPGWLKNPDKKISYKELLEIESLDKAKSEIVIREVDTLMRDSHHAQITFLDGRLKLGIEEGFDRWKDFLEITERRNLFVHTGGAISPPYLDNCKRWQIPLPEKVKLGGYLSASDEYIARAVDCFYESSVRLLQASVRRLFPTSYDGLDSHLNNKTVELLTNERWDLAERLFEYAIHIPKDLRGKGEIEYFYLVNLCIALKFAGKNFEERLHAIDWRPFHPKYHFAVAILEDRFEEAEKLMRTSAVQEEVSELHFKDWPLLREFRKTERFPGSI
jgi:hypothetical protein